MVIAQHCSCLVFFPTGNSFDRILQIIFSFPDQGGAEEKYIGKHSWFILKEDVEQYLNQSAYCRNLSLTPIKLLNFEILYFTASNI